jgi:uncharacterized protein YaaR (DUF327 family)
MSLRVSDVLAAKLAETGGVTKDRPVQADFSFALDKVSDESLVKKLSGMIDDITHQGKVLSEHMDLSELKRYRSMVHDFINEVVGNSHEFSRENFLDRRGRHRVFGLVKLVNKNLDDLAQELLGAEKNNLKILEKVDEIRGLLLDILI